MREALLGVAVGKKGIGKTFTTLQIISLLSAMVALLRSYHIAIDYCAAEFNLKRKIIFIKGIIVVFAIQNIIVNNNFGGNDGGIE